MLSYLIDFSNFMLRWLHVIAAIAWIGESIYFVMLDNGLKSPKDENCRKKGVFGEMWAVHGGGFYHNQKYATSRKSCLMTSTGLSGKLIPLGYLASLYSSFCTCLILAFIWLIPTVAGSGLPI